MKIIKQSVGADIAKDKFDACFSLLTSEQRVVVKASHKFPNSPKGFAGFSKWVSKWADPSVELLFILEATGVYHENLAWQLHRAGQKVAIVLPNRAKKYTQSLGHKSKNDRIDAKSLAHMGAERNLTPWQPMSRQLYLLRKLTREHEQIHQMRTQVRNRLHAETHSMMASRATQRRLEKTLKLYQTQLQAIEQEIKTAVESDPFLKEKLEKVTSIKGVGFLTAATVIAETDGFALFTSQKQLTSYAGYDVVENQSGKRSGRTRISKQGNSHIRRVLHMPAFNAVSRNVPVCRALYERLTGKGKKKMVAYVAVQKKLLVLIYTLWKRNEAWQQDRYAQQEPKGAIQILEAGASLSGAGEAGKSTVAPAVARATQDEHPVPVGPGALFQVV